MRVEQFEGPLDLLLQLIEKEELDITQLSLAAIADQYLQQVSELSHQGKQLEELADFLVVAAKLILIKSRLLLPQLEGDGNEAEDLNKQLKIYREFARAAKILEKIYNEKKVSFPRPFSPPEFEHLFSPPSQATADTLMRAFVQVLYHIELPKQLPKSIYFDSRVSIHEKMQQLKDMLSSNMKLYFHSVLASASSKTEVIVSFLALLELIKQRLVVVEQEKLFDDIIVNVSVGSMRSNQKGSTLIELITAIFMLSLALVSALAFTTVNFKNESIGASRLVASNLAREGVELSRNIRDTNWIKGEAFNTGLENGCSIIPSTIDRFTLQVACPEKIMEDTAFRIYRDTNKKTLYQGQTGLETEQETQFYRSIAITPVCIKIVDGISTDTPDVQCSSDETIGLQVSSDVHWVQGGSEYNVRMTEQLYNWR
ncbi:MAG: segregation/condensation protein A [bacterium]|nr:segregation/condensation protein A [bacterium]